MATVKYYLNLCFIKFNAILKFTTAANITTPRKMDFANQFSIKNSLNPHMYYRKKLEKV